MLSLVSAIAPKRQAIASAPIGILELGLRTHSFERYPPPEPCHPPLCVGVASSEGVAKPDDGLPGEVARGVLNIARPPPGAHGRAGDVGLSWPRVFPTARLLRWACRPEG